MKYTLEIEENERTLEFNLDVECKYWSTPGRISGKWEDSYEADGGFDIISVDIESVQIFNQCGESPVIDDGVRLDNAKKDYQSKIQTILEKDEKLFEAWKKHTEDI